MAGAAGTRRRRRGKDSDDSDAKASASTLKRALQPGQAWSKETFPELMDVVYWIRQVVALVVGVVWGFIPMLGLTGIISFGAISAALLFIYYSKFLGVDEESYGQWELMKEGFMPSFGVFLLAWTLTYTAVHHPGDLM